ncbi:MAG: AMP-binding protein, partial [Acidaminobacteraceae bacterium]
MLINRLNYLIKNKIIQEEKPMLEYGERRLTYRVFLDVLSCLTYKGNFEVSSKVTHVHYKTDNPLITLLMFYHYTSKGKVYLMLPDDIENTLDMFASDSALLIEGHDNLIYSLIDSCSVDKNKVEVSKSKEEDKVVSIDEYDDSIFHSKLDDLFLRAYSSGTSGMRKQVERSYRSWFDAFDIQNAIFGISSDTVAYIKGDINYTGNLNYILGVIHVGGTIIISSKRGVKDMIDYIKTAKINNAFLVPTVLGVLARYINRSSSSVDYGENNITLVTAGEKLQEFVYKELKLKLKNSRIIEYYGASEVGHISYSIDDEILIGSGYVGKPFTGVNIKILKDKIYTNSPYHAI